MAVTLRVQSLVYTRHPFRPPQGYLTVSATALDRNAGRWFPEVCDNVTVWEVGRSRGVEYP
jgi:hypothetical protein